MSLVAILSQANPLYILTLCFFTTPVIITLLTTTRLHAYTFFIRTMHATCPVEFTTFLSSYSLKTFCCVGVNSEFWKMFQLFSSHLCAAIFFHTLWDKNMHCTFSSATSPNWLSHKSDILQALRWSRRAWGGMRAVPRLSILYPGICLTTEENHGKPQSGYPKGARLISAERDSFSRRNWTESIWLTKEIS